MARGYADVNVVTIEPLDIRPPLRHTRTVMSRSFTSSAAPASAALLLALTAVLATRGAMGQSGDLIVVPEDSWEDRRPAPDAGTDAGTHAGIDVGANAGMDGGPDSHPDAARRSDADMSSPFEIVRLNETLPELETGSDVEMRPPDHRPEIVQAIATRAIRCVASTASPKRSRVGFEFDLPQGSIRPRLTGVTNTHSLHVSTEYVEFLRFFGPLRGNVSVTEGELQFHRCLEQIRLPHAPKKPAVLTFWVKWSVDGYDVYDVVWETGVDD